MTASSSGGSAPPPGSAAAPGAPKTNLSHILSPSAACHTLGQDAVRPIVRAFLRYVASGAHRNHPHRMGRAGGGYASPRAVQRQRSVPCGSPDDPSSPFPFGIFPPSFDYAPLVRPEESDDEAEWINHFGRALFFDFEGLASAAAANGIELPPPPAPVSLAWRRMLSVAGTGTGGGPTPSTGASGGGGADAIFPVLGLDKASALGEGALLPPSAAPHPGPGGHMALMECLFHALAYVPPSSPSASSVVGGGGGGGVPPPVPPKRGKRRSRKADLKAAVERQMMSASASVHGRARSVILLPDLLVFFAVCRQYRDECQAGWAGLANAEGRRYATMLASLLSFRVYDGYQKRGTVRRETVQRFLSDVHGEGYHRRHTVKRVLDAIFTVQEYTRNGGSGGSGVGVSVGVGVGVGVASSPARPDASPSSSAGGGASTTASSSSPPSQPKETLLKPSEFCLGISSTVSVSSSGRSSHVLLDWIVALGNAMLPPSLVPSDETPPGGGLSTRRLVRDKREMILEKDPDASLRRLCRRYGVGRKRLAEVRRRFAGLASASDSSSRKRANAKSGHGGGSGEGGDGESARQCRLPLEEADGRRRSVSLSSDAAFASVSSNNRKSFPGANGNGGATLGVEDFVRAVSAPDDADGGAQHGGFLTPNLARLAFRGGRLARKRRRGWEMSADNGVASGDGGGDNGGTEAEEVWTLREAVGFGCVAVREEVFEWEEEEEEEDAEARAERSLLEFVFLGFLTLSSAGEDDPEPEEKEVDDARSEIMSGGDPFSRMALSRTQIGRMILLLLEHSEFRLRADSPPESDDSGERVGILNSHEGLRRSSGNGSGGSLDGNENAGLAVAIGESIATKTVDATAASLLGMLPHDLDGDDAVQEDGTVRLETLVNYVLVESVEGDKESPSSTDDDVPPPSRRPGTLPFAGFLRWHRAARPGSVAADLPPSQRRAGPLLLDLRLVAGVLLGLRPSNPDTERALVEEATRRHKYRHPASEPRSKRGPPGTAWYVMDVRWTRSWREHTLGTLDGMPTGRRRSRAASLTLSDDASAMSADVSEGGGCGDDYDDDDDVDSPTLGRIDNKALLEQCGLALRRGLKWQRDFELVPPLAWEALHAWHDGGPPIRRSVVPCGAASGLASPGKSSRNSFSSSLSFAPLQNEIELYPLFATIQMCSAAAHRGVDDSSPGPFQQAVPFSRHRPVRDVLESLCRGVGNISPKNARLWISATLLSSLRQLSSKNEHIDIIGGEGDVLDSILYLDTSLDQQLSERGVSVDVFSSGTSISKEGNSGSGEGPPKLALILEVRDSKDSTWPRSLANDSNYNANSGVGREEGEAGNNAALMQDGNVGLYNFLGNTGYLNASLQCLSHTPILRDYFTTGEYLKDVNKENPLGQQGHLAEVTATIIKELWKGGGSATPLTKTTGDNECCTPIQAPMLAPKTFKEAIGESNKHFDSNEQHDAQEFLAFLLRALSADLNLVTDELSATTDAAADHQEQDAADAWWSKQLEREMSIVKALFSGQYKSVITCQTCSHSSTAFEPSMFLQLPLPQQEEITVHLILYPLQYLDCFDGTISTTKYAVKVRRDGTIHDVLLSLAKVLRADKPGKNEEASGTGCTGALIGDEENLDACGGSDTEDKLAYEQIANNLVAVKMKKGYIYNIIPTKLPLCKIQGKDATCDVDLLHVYELDPLPSHSPDETNNDAEEMMVGVDKDTLIQRLKSDGANKRGSMNTAGCGESLPGEDHSATESVSTESSEKSKFPIGQESFLAVVQRKGDLANRPLFHPYLQCVFGTPLLLRVQGIEEFTGRELYDLVAKKVARVVPEAVCSFLRTSPSFPPECIIDTPQDLGHGDNARSTNHMRQRSSAEDASTGCLPRHGFRLCITSRDGSCCSLCPWFECCLGCVLPDDDQRTFAVNGDTIALDWHMAVDLSSLGFEAIDSNTCENIRQHKSCAAVSTGTNEPLPLEECISAFSNEETIPKAFCSHCNESRVHKRRLSCVKLPPIVIVHLKRFVFVDKIKQTLQNLVGFSDGVDFMRLLSCKSSFEPTRNRNQREEHSIMEEEETLRDRIWANGAGKDTVDGALDGEELRKLEPVYDTYAVIHHHGAPTRGHYVASIKSQIDGKWRLFNDASLYEVKPPAVVDSSAYLLFYVRRDVKHSVQEFWDAGPGRHESKDAAEEKMEIHSGNGTTPHKKWFRFRKR